MFENVLKKKSVINIKEKNLVLAVIKSDLSDFIRGNFETKAQSLAMRLAVARLLATLLRLGMFFLFYVIFYVNYLFVQATKLSLNVSSGKFLPINTKVDLRSVSFQSRPREISKLI